MAVVMLAAAPATFGLSPGTARGDKMNCRGDYAGFASQVGTEFRVLLPSGEKVDLKLAKAELARGSAAAATRGPLPDAHHEKFSLIFRGPEQYPLPPAIHALEHERLGRFEIYFGEIGARDGGGIRYEAVFSRVV